MIFAPIRQAIIDEINSPDFTKIKVAYRTPISTMSGFPAAIVTPSENEADYGATDNDKITVIFKVRLYYPVKTEKDYDIADIALEEALDEFLNVFKERNILGAACDWVEPAPSVWAFDERGEGVYRVAEITLRCVKYVAN